VLNELEIECLPGQLPEFINVDLSKIEAGGSIHTDDLVLPTGVKALTHGQNLTVATAMVPAGAAAAEAAAAAEEEKK
jgi:large subunit ribosomal protein L25